MINKYGTLPFDIWNFDKSKFIINVLRSSIAVIGIDSINKQSNIQSKNQKWIIIIKIINTENVIFLSMIIFQKKLHQEIWYNFDWFNFNWLINFNNNN